MANEMPAWWSDQHASRWSRIRGALRRDWEQTKSDLAGRGSYLNQGAGDTVRQMRGDQLIPPGDMPTESVELDWAELEDAIRYGVAASQEYCRDDWASAAPALEREWHELHTGLGWERAKVGIWFGWHANRGTMV